MSHVNIGSYDTKDVVMLLKNVDGMVMELTIEEREHALQSGKSYGTVIPKEQLPSKEYIELFEYSLNKYSASIAKYVAIVAEKILLDKPIANLVLVSLARAGTPIGILVKRYLLNKYKFDVPHYSISILDHAGLDLNAIKYVLRTHPSAKIQFIDGWTGKGFVSNVLAKSCNTLSLNNNIDLDPTLAVLADPGHCTRLFGTRDDFLIPNACLNSTISGLLSRTVYDVHIIDKHEFHGAKFFKEYMKFDMSNMYVDHISQHFGQIKNITLSWDNKVTFLGQSSVEQIKRDYFITNDDYIKPGVNETTRMLLIRVPWKILIKDIDNPYLEHIRVLAKEKNVPIEIYPNMSYACCGLIQTIK